jgi:PmbA protein
MPSPFDQSSLTEIAERLVAAALRHGADAADAVAVRGISQSIDVRDGSVEESQRSEGDNVGLRAFVGRRQAVVSTNDLSGQGGGVDAIAERVVAMARAAPEDRFAGLADPAFLARDLPDLDLLDEALPTVRDLEELARAAERAATAIKGVTKSGGASASAGIGGMVLVTSGGFRGAYLGSRHGVSIEAIAGEGTGMERDYDFSSARHGADLEAAEKIGRSAGERAVKRLNPRKVSTRRVPVVYDQRVASSLVGHLSSAINGSALARKTSFLQNALGERIFADCASARELGLATTGHAQRGVSGVPSPGATNLHLEPGRASPQELIADIEDGLYVTDLIGMGANIVTGDYSRGAAGFWIERGELTYPVSEVTIAGNLRNIFRTLTPANDLVFRQGTNAPTVRVEDLTVAGV